MVFLKSFFFFFFVSSFNRLMCISDNFHWQSIVGFFCVYVKVFAILFGIEMWRL